MLYSSLEVIYVYAHITLMAIYGTLMSCHHLRPTPSDIRVFGQALFKKLDLSGDEEIEYSHLARLHLFVASRFVAPILFSPFSWQHVTIIGTWLLGNGVRTNLKIECILPMACPPFNIKK